MDRNDKKRLTLESYRKIDGPMKEFDQDIKKLSDHSLIKPNFRLYKSKLYNNSHKKYAYVTSVFINESYLPAALVLGKNLKLLKHKYPSVCIVQDKSYKVLKGDQYEYFQGVSEKGISDLLEFYDYVIGVDLLKVNHYVQSPYHFTNRDNYSNILYYVTKGQILGLTMFEKVMYLDASSYLENNIDSVFTTFEKSTFLGDGEFQATKVGLHGAFFLVTPNKYFYHKHMLFVKDYKKYFDDLYFMRGVDELLIFYSVFPEWSNLHFDSHFACRKNKMGSLQDCDIYHFQFTKPFRKDEKEVDLGENMKRHYTYYDDWDKLVKLLLKSHPHLAFYFQHMKSFRKTHF